jgi:hypothetical protein
MLAGKYSSYISNRSLADDETCRMKKIQDLKLTAFLPEDKENSILDVAMWYSAKNACERQEEGGCITKNGIYFGTTDSLEPQFCPAHFFADDAYTIKPTA